MKKLTIEDCKRVAQSKEGKRLSKEYKNKKKKLTIKDCHDLAKSKEGRRLSKKYRREVI